MTSRNCWLILLMVATLSSCKTTDRDSKLQGFQALEKRSQDIHRSVVDRLKTDKRLKGAVGQAWFEDKIALRSDWIVQTPEDYWGKAAAELPINLTCTEKDAGCDLGFDRRTCETDADCAPYHASCSALSSTVMKPGAPMRKMCVGSGDSILERYYSAITSAEQYLDVVTLALPVNSFYTMFVNALTVLSHKQNVPKIRILLSSKLTRTLSLSYPPNVVLDELIKDIKANGGQVDRLQIDLGYLNFPQYMTWNHAKVIVVDGDRVVQGGHNFYAPDYTSDFPVFDLSMEFNGQGVQHVQSFVNYLWSLVSYNTGLIAGEGHSITAWSYWPNDCMEKADCRRYRTPASIGTRIDASAKKLLPPNLTPKTKGNVAAIGVTQLGAYKKTDSDVTDVAFEALFESAKESIYIAQEDFFSSMPVKYAGTIQLKTGLDRSNIMVRLINLIANNDRLKIRLVQTDQFAPSDPDGYGMLTPQTAQARIIAAAVDIGKKNGIKAPQGKTLAQHMCSKFELAPWRFTQGVRAFQNGKQIGSHPKLIIIDESSFYLGSYNLYPSNLVEFGMVISDQKATKDILEQYWNPLWKASAQDKLSCDRPDSELLKVL